MRRRHPCIRCGRSTRGSVRFPLVEEAHRLVACSGCAGQVRASVARQITPELRLLYALHGDVTAMVGKHWTERGERIRGINLPERPAPATMGGRGA